MRRLFLILMILSFALSANAEGGELLQTDTLKMQSGKSSGFQVKNRFLPTRKRIDREINKNVFAYKGELAVGLTASYGTITSGDSDILAVLENINASGSITTIAPFMSYFVSDNMSIGVRLGYTNISGKLNNMDVNLGSQNDVGISIPSIDLSSSSMRGSFFLRNYAPIDAAGRFGVFSEIEASVGVTNNKFGFRSGEDSPTNYTNSESLTVKLWFNPGVAVYMFPNVCATISFGMGGFKYTSVKQFDEQGKQSGSRDFSKLRFRLNLADIHFGLNVHLWAKNKKK